MRLFKKRTRVRVDCTYIYSQQHTEQMVYIESALYDNQTLPPQRPSEPRYTSLPSPPQSISCFATLNVDRKATVDDFQHVKIQIKLRVIYITLSDKYRTTILNGKVGSEYQKRASTPSGREDPFEFRLHKVSPRCVCLAMIDTVFQLIHVLLSNHLVTVLVAVLNHSGSYALSLRTSSLPLNLSRMLGKCCGGILSPRLYQCTTQRVSNVSDILNCAGNIQSLHRPTTFSSYIKTYKSVRSA